MTKIEALFKEYRRDSLITYEEFAYAGWTKEIYVTYLSICERIRATCIFLQDMPRTETTIKNHQKLKEDFFTYEIDRLSNWLSQYFENPISLKWQYGALERYVRCSICIPRISSEFKRLSSIVYTSSDDFRYQIERLITLILLDDYAQIYGDDIHSLSLERILKARNEQQEKIDNNTEPDFPGNIDSYATLQKWASEYDDYLTIDETYQYEVDALDELIEQRFIPSRDTLYVYSGNPICLDCHYVICVTAVIPSINGKSYELNVNYCTDCRKFFLKYSEYERYQKLYNYMLVRIEYIECGTGSSFFTRKEYSPLRLCGYSVSKETGLTEMERHDILGSLIDNGVFSKSEIIAHLDMLIDTNGELKNMRDARGKWEADLFFVRNYDICIQSKTMIDETIAVSKSLKTFSQQYKG